MRIIMGKKPYGLLKSTLVFVIFVNDEPESNPRGGVRISVQRHFKLLK